MAAYSEYIGDGIVENLEIDFKAKRVTLEVKRWENEELSETVTVVFSGVELQEFWDFGNTTILFNLREADSSSEFMNLHADYFHRMRKHLPSALLDEINSDPANRFFSFESTCGFEGFVICKEFQLSNYSPLTTKE
ncbi:hypothetical protein LRS06_20630 [Hymenobacter sp. J193]|uniref:hypothetical protein n=1 Tax=Hymenobacter sp. J193 TaxID=2898429 RepID=UPI002151FAE7|nr:hypothetical protein [Hymenobacter sp. J193]MCR5890136.1 hypothetical protein [Hymenobacter sp. J193]